jgi:hypothetical protein
MTSRAHQKYARLPEPAALGQQGMDFFARVGLG